MDNQTFSSRRQRRENRKATELITLKEKITINIKKGWTEFSGWAHGYKDIDIKDNLGLEIKDYILSHLEDHNPNLRNTWKSAFIGGYFCTYKPEKNIVSIEV